MSSNLKSPPLFETVLKNAFVSPVLSKKSWEDYKNDQNFDLSYYTDNQTGSGSNFDSDETLYKLELKLDDLNIKTSGMYFVVLDCSVSEYQSENELRKYLIDYLGNNDPEHNNYSLDELILIAGDYKLTIIKGEWAVHARNYNDDNEDDNESYWENGAHYRGDGSRY